MAPGEATTNDGLQSAVIGVFDEQKHVTASARGARPHDAAAEVRYLATTGWSGNEEELAATLKTFADVGTDERT